MKKNIKKVKHNKFPKKLLIFIIFLVLFSLLIIKNINIQDKVAETTSPRANTSSKNRAARKIAHNFKTQFSEAEESQTQINQTLALRVDIDTYEKAGKELLKSGPVIVAIVAADNKLPNYLSDLERLEKIDDPNVTKIIGFSSYKTLNEKLSDNVHVDYLKFIHIAGFTYNTERQHTPLEEMSSLKLVGSENFAVKFASLTSANGFKSYWVPAGEELLDNITPDALKSMANSGLSGVVIQEQRRIEASCPADRAQAVNQWITKIVSSGENLEIGLQLMTDRCQTADIYAQANCSDIKNTAWASCNALVSMLNDKISFISIWTPLKQNENDLINFVQTIRSI